MGNLLPSYRKKWMTGCGGRLKSQNGLQQLPVLYSTIIFRQGVYVRGCMGVWYGCMGVCMFVGVCLYGCVPVCVRVFVCIGMSMYSRRTYVYGITGS
jgi:hypothetical protein